MQKYSKVLLVILMLPLVLLANDNNNKGSENQDNAQITWLTIEEVEEKVKKEPRMVFVDVYTDWCGWCKKMDKATFADPSVAAYVNKHFYAVKMNAEGKTPVTFLGQTVSPAELSRAMGVSGYPTIVFIDPGFKNVQPVSGYRGAEEFIDILMQLTGEKKVTKPANN
jgi:thioredoxin-related protein